MGEQSRFLELISKHKLIVAFACALLFHSVLIGVYWQFDARVSNTRFVELPLSVSIQLEDQAPEPIVEEVKQEVEKEVALEPEPTPTPTAKPQITSGLLTVKEESTQEAAEPRIKISPNSKEFRRFLRSETDDYIEKNPGTVGRFDRTFEVAPVEGYAEELSPYHSDSIPKGGNNDFAVAQDGRVTCVVRTLNMLDVTASPNFVSKDCTPKEKFELDLNKPNNGWMDR